MRRTAYVGASVGAAAAVILRAFHERPNFYSAAVYLGQSTACRMILLNMLLLTLATSMYGLQRLLYGPLRAIEIEQLWDKAWYAITETALAMTTFRDEVGGYFFLMFMTLLGGKVWGWIGEGRVETMEQQPPANPKTFYARLTTSLVLSELFDLLMLRYCVRSILDQRAPRAGMMIMFVFEFAILAISSASTLSRYGLALWERWVIKQQMQTKIEERREEIRVERARIPTDLDARAAAGSTLASSTSLEHVEVDENEIDVPGWQEKGKWVLFLDLTTDFLKLVFYMTFFLILIIFAGIPIHMFRDLFITTRSFLKRINDYLKYRNATRDMNSRYPDATVEELRRDGTCIICREEMRPWQTPHVVGGPGQNDARPTRSPPDERHRPKKLPCGHVLHFGCLRSWLERQQVCPTCRRSVLAPDPARSVASQAPPGNGGHPNGGNGQGQHGQHHNQPPPQGPGANQQAGHQHGQGDGPGINRMRTFNLGGIRLTFATGRGANVRDALNHANNHGNNVQAAGAANATNTNNTSAHSNSQTGLSANVSADLNNLEQRLMQEISSLALAQQELHLIRAMQGELARLRMLRNHANRPNVTTVHYQQYVQYGPTGAAHYMSPMPTGEQQVMTAPPQSEVLRSGDSSLPDGLTLPDGWSLLPLNRWNAGQHGRSGEGVDQAPSSDAAPDPHDGQGPPAQQDGDLHPSQNSSGGAVPNRSTPMDSTASTNGQPSRDATPSLQTTSDDEPHPSLAMGTSAPQDPPQGVLSTGQAPLSAHAIEDRSKSEETTGNQLVHRTEDTIAKSSNSVADIPDWSSIGQPAESAGVGANGHVHVDKGKGRAAHVEETANDDS